MDLEWDIITSNGPPQSVWSESNQYTNAAMGRNLGDFKEFYDGLWGVILGAADDEELEDYLHVAQLL